MNCQNCGKHMSRYDLGKWKKDGHPLCADCRKKELREMIAGHTPKFIEALKRNPHDRPLIEAILKEHVSPTSPGRKTDLPFEQRTDALKKTRCKAGEVYDETLRKCVKVSAKQASDLQVGSGDSTHGTAFREQVLVPHQPAPEVPTQPTTLVGPVTVEQKIEALEAEIQAIKLEISNMQGILVGLETLIQRR